jgi:hypothetical protein
MHTGARVESFAGQPGAFSARLSDGANVDAASTILCTGFTHVDSVNKPEWGFGTFPDVVTTTQVEQMISSGKGVRCPSDGRKPKRVAILPGSRRQEIERILPTMLDTAKELRRRDPSTTFLVAAASEESAALIETQLVARPAEERVAIGVVTGQMREVARQARAAMVCSGTATVETALLKCPMIVVYRAAPLTSSLWLPAASWATRPAAAGTLAISGDSNPSQTRDCAGPRGEGAGDDQQPPAGRPPVSDGGDESQHAAEDEHPTCERGQYNGHVHH